MKKKPWPGRARLATATLVTGATFAGMGVVPGPPAQADDTGPSSQVASPAEDVQRPIVSGALATYSDASGEPLEVAVGAELHRGAPDGTALMTAEGGLSSDEPTTYEVQVSEGTTSRIGGTDLGPGVSQVAVGPEAVPFSLRTTDTSGRAVLWRELGTDEPFRPVEGRHLVPVHASDGAGESADLGVPDSNDGDSDDIPDDWEVNGYTTGASPTGPRTIRAWVEGEDDGRAVKYQSHPDRYSSSGDPWSDLQKVTGAQLDPRISPEARHPLVAAMPDVAVNLHSYRLVPLSTLSSGSGGSASRSVNQSTSSTVSNSLSATLGTECSASVTKLGCSVSASLTTTTTVAVADERGSTNSSASEWNELIQTSNADAAVLLPTVQYENRGTAPISQATPVFTISDGDRPLISTTSSVANRLAVAGPGETYPTGSQRLVLDRAGDVQQRITLDAEAVRRLSPGGGSRGLTVATTDVDAPVVLIGTQNEPRITTEKWTDRTNLVKSVTAKINVEKVSGDDVDQENGNRVEQVTRYVAAPRAGHIEDTAAPRTTVREALKLAYGAVEKGGTLQIDGVPVDSSAFSVTLSPTTQANFAGQRGEFLDKELAAGDSVDLQRHPVRVTPLSLANGSGPRLAEVHVRALDPRVRRDIGRLELEIAGIRRPVQTDELNGHRSFTAAMFGLDESAFARGDAVLTVWGDGKLLQRHALGEPVRGRR